MCFRGGVLFRERGPVRLGPRLQSAFPSFLMPANRPEHSSSLPDEKQQPGREGVEARTHPNQGRRRLPLHPTAPLPPPAHALAVLLLQSARWRTGGLGIAPLLPCSPAVPGKCQGTAVHVLELSQLGRQASRVRLPQSSGQQAPCCHQCQPVVLQPTANLNTHSKGVEIGRQLVALLRHVRTPPLHQGHTRRGGGKGAGELQLHGS